MQRIRVYSRARIAAGRSGFRFTLFSFRATVGAPEFQGARISPPSKGVRNGGRVRGEVKGEGRGHQTCLMKTLRILLDEALRE